MHKQCRLYTKLSTEQNWVNINLNLKLRFGSVALNEPNYKILKYFSLWIKIWLFLNHLNLELFLNLVLILEQSILSSNLKPVLHSTLEIKCFFSPNMEFTLKIWFPWVRVSWWQTLCFTYLKMSLYHFLSWKTVSLGIQF